MYLKKNVIVTNFVDIWLLNETPSDEEIEMLKESNPRVGQFI